MASSRIVYEDGSADLELQEPFRQRWETDTAGLRIVVGVFGARQELRSV